MPSNPEFDLPHPIQMRGSPLARRLLAVMGWKVAFAGLPAKQGVLVVYPHTSNWDFIMLVLAKWSVGLQLSFWGKDTLFAIPLFGRWLRWLGGQPVIRNTPKGVVGQAVDVLQQHKALDAYHWLGLSPEGTRKLTAGWRSGFYQTALQARVPVCIVLLDFAQRRVIANQFVRLSGDSDSDMARIASMLHGVKGQNPELASPIRLIGK